MEGAPPPPLPPRTICDATKHYGLWIIVPDARMLQGLLSSRVYWPVSLEGVPGSCYEIPLPAEAGTSEMEREIVLISTFLEATLPAMYQQICSATQIHSFGEVHLIEAAIRHCGGGDMAITEGEGGEEGDGQPDIGVVRHTNWIEQAYVSAQGTPRLMDNLVRAYAAPMHHVLCVPPCDQVAYEYDTMPIITSIANFCYPFYTSMANEEIPSLALLVFSKGGPPAALHAVLDVYHRTPHERVLRSMCQVCTQRPVTYTIPCGHCALCRDCIPPQSSRGLECIVCGARFAGAFATISSSFLP